MVTQALEMQPENASYLDTRGWVHYRLGEYKDAETYLLRSVGTGGGSATVLDHLGDVYRELGDREKARSYWNKALDLEPTNTIIREKVSRRD